MGCKQPWSLLAGHCLTIHLQWYTGIFVVVVGVIALLLMAANSVLSTQDGEISFVPDL